MALPPPLNRTWRGSINQHQQQTAGFRIRMFHGTGLSLKRLFSQATEKYNAFKECEGSLSYSHKPITKHHP
jgi:hypothetical protein